jgi:hypothetical protein
MLCSSVFEMLSVHEIVEFSLQVFVNKRHNLMQGRNKEVSVSCRVLVPCTRSKGGQMVGSENTRQDTSRVITPTSRVDLLSTAGSRQRDQQLPNCQSKKPCYRQVFCTRHGILPSHDLVMAQVVGVASGYTTRPVIVHVGLLTRARSSGALAMCSRSSIVCSCIARCARRS